jgi:hypothetical protein
MSRLFPFSALIALAVFSGCAGEDEDELDDDIDETGESVDDISTAGRWVPPSGNAAKSDPAPAWAGGKNCLKTALPGTTALRRTINSKFSGVNASYPYNCRPNTANPNITSTHGMGRAIDVMISTVGSKANRKVGDPVASYLVKNARSLGVQTVIWDRTLWSANSPSGRAYSGGSRDPHINHIHVELNVDGAKQ